MWCLMPVIPKLGWLSQEGCYDFAASLSFSVVPFQTITNANKWTTPSPTQPFYIVTLMHAFQHLPITTQIKWFTPSRPARTPEWSTRQPSSWVMSFCLWWPLLPKVFLAFFMCSSIYQPALLSTSLCFGFLTFPLQKGGACRQTHTSTGSAV